MHGVLTCRVDGKCVSHVRREVWVKGGLVAGAPGCTGLKAKSNPLLFGFPRERGPQRTQLIPLAPRGSSSDRHQPVGCLGYPHRMNTHMHGRRWVMCTPRLPPQDNHRSAGRHLPGLFAIWYTRARRLHPQPVDGAKNPAGIEPGEVRLASSHSFVGVMTRCSPARKVPS
jgi:hypothetical protein